MISALPREELFSATEQQLHDTAVGVLAVAGRRAVRVFLRPDPYRPVHLVPGLRPARPVHHVVAHGDGRGAADAAATARPSTSPSGSTESALALVHFTVHLDPDRRGPGARRRRGAAGRARRGDPHLGRPPAVAARQPGRRRAARRGPRGVQGGGRPGAGAGGPALRRGPARARRLRAAALRPVGRPGAAVHPLPGRRLGDADGRAAAAAAARRGRAGRAAVGDRAPGRPALLDLRLRAAHRRRHPRRARRPAAERGRRPVHRGIRGGLARRGGDRRVQRARAAHGAVVARGRRAARLRPLRAPARQPLRRRLHGRDTARPPRGGARTRRPVPGAFRSRARPGRAGRRRGRRAGHGAGADRRRHRAWTPTASCAATSA